MNGKSKCKLLKEIRRQIAAQNDIEFVTSECKFQGNCSGTCPKCEAEVRYLEAELRKRQMIGGKIAVAGIAAALVVTASGCMPVQTGGDPLPGPNYTENAGLQGDVALPTDPTESTEDLFMGIPETLPTESTEPTNEDVLMGDPVPDTGEVPVQGEMLPKEDGE